MPYDDEMQVSLHPKMASWLQNELENGRFEVAEEGDDKILDDTLKQIQPAPEPSKEEMAVIVAMDRLSNARSKVHVLKSTLDSVTGGFVYPFHDIDAAHGTLKYQMIPLARDYAKALDEIADLTAERDNLREERNGLAEQARQAEDDTLTANEELEGANARIAYLETQTPSPITVKAKEELWAVLSVQNQTDAMAKLRLWRDLVRQRNELLEQLGASNGYDAQHTVRRLREFVGHVGCHFGKRIPTTKVTDWTGIARNLAQVVGITKAH